MKRLNVTLALAAAVIVAATGSASFAQYESPRPPAATTAQPAPTSAPVSDRDQRKAAKKAERQDKRAGCRDQAKQQGLKGDAMKDFQKSCMGK